jgi:hypothetical protein
VNYETCIHNTDIDFAGFLLERGLEYRGFLIAVEFLYVEPSTQAFYIQRLAFGLDAA